MESEAKHDGFLCSFCPITFSLQDNRLFHKHVLSGSSCCHKQTGHLETSSQSHFYRAANWKLSQRACRSNFNAVSFRFLFVCLYMFIYKVAVSQLSLQTVVDFWVRPEQLRRIECWREVKYIGASLRVATTRVARSPPQQLGAQ